MAELKKKKKKKEVKEDNKDLTEWHGLTALQG